MSEKLDILVVEDTPVHQDSARKLIGHEHDLRIVGTYAEEIKALKERKPGVLLTDMMFPLGQGPTSDLYCEAPLGYALALYAARPHIAVPRIVMLTDCNHHSNAVSATFDDFIIGYGKVNQAERTCGKSNRSRPVLRLNDSFFAMFDARDLIKAFMTPEGVFGDWLLNGKKREDGCGYDVPQGSIEVKNWKRALDAILEV